MSSRVVTWSFDLVLRARDCVCKSLFLKNITCHIALSDTILQWQGVVHVHYTFISTIVQHTLLLPSYNITEHIIVLANHRAYYDTRKKRILFEP